MLQPESRMNPTARRSTRAWLPARACRHSNSDTPAKSRFFADPTARPGGQGRARHGRAWPTPELRRPGQALAPRHGQGTDL